MSDYTPSGLPEDNTRGIASQVRDELIAVQTAINSKSDLHGTTSVSTTSMAVSTTPVTKNFTIEADKELVAGMTVFIADAAAPGTNNMTGTILTYDADTGAISVAVTTGNGSGTKTAWVIGLSNSSGVTLVSNTFTGYQNFARATVASHATTADIWNATGNQINWTGVVTTTAFPAAAQAGAMRELICAAACSFTAGANMLIDGIASGATYTCAANDIVIVRAVTTTQFRLSIIRYDGYPITWPKVRSIFHAHTGNGHGSSNNKWRVFTTIMTNTGTDMTISNSATLGLTVTIVTPGVYNVIYSETGLSTGGAGITLNSSQGTTAFESVTESTKLVTIGQSVTASASVSCYLTTGDVLTFHTAGVGQVTDSDPHTRVRVERIA